MSTVDVTRDAPRLEPNSIDPNVRVPSHVTEAAARAEALHKSIFTPPEPTPEEKAAAEAAARAEADAAAVKAANEAAEKAEAERSAALAAQHEQAPPATQSQTHEPDADKSTALGTAEQERGRYLSMKGRYEASQRQLAAQEEQLKQLAVELTRTQNLLQVSPPAPTQHTPTNHKSVITDEDRQNYGEELIDVARRAAIEALSPELEALRAQNAQLTARVKSTGKRELFATLDRTLPSWRQINESTQFKAWLALPNLYTRQVRGKMLNEAVAGANAPVVLALFNDFLREAGVTSQPVPAQQQEQQPAPRAAAVPLESLAAPGRARPAPGDTQVAGEKPIYSRQQIAANYEQHRKGLWNHRLGEWAQLEADMIAAGREGRVRG